jgi:hypothetical protein
MPLVSELTPSSSVCTPSLTTLGSIELLERFVAVHASSGQIQILRFQPQLAKRRVEVRFLPPLRRRQGAKHFLLENRMRPWLLRLRSASVLNFSQRMP